MVMKWFWLAMTSLYMSDFSTLTEMALAEDSPLFSGLDSQGASSTTRAGELRKGGFYKFISLDDF